MCVCVTQIGGPDRESLTSSWWPQSLALRLHHVTAFLTLSADCVDQSTSFPVYRSFLLFLPDLHLLRRSCPLSDPPRRSSDGVRRRPPRSSSSSSRGPLLPVLLHLRVCSALPGPMAARPLPFSRRGAQQERANPAAHRPAARHPVAVHVEERRPHGVYGFVWERWARTPPQSSHVNSRFS